MRGQLQIDKFGRALCVAIITAALFLTAPAAYASITPIQPPGPKSNSYGLEATKTQPAPTESATISSPGNGSSFNNSPITVSGLCKTGLIVQVYDNGALVGAVVCANGSYSLQVSLFTGQNDLSATLFDDLGQSGPAGNTVSVSYDNASFSAFGQLITLTSNYGRRASQPGTPLTWPILLTGGTGPYAFSIDWGDGTAADLKSEPLAGTINIEHTYKQAGVYKMTVKVTDVNGVSAFLQLVAVANGQPTTSGSTGGSSKGGTIYVTRIIWIPAVVCLILLPVAYWLGRRSQLVSLHRKLEHDMANFKEL